MKIKGNQNLEILYLKLSWYLKCMLLIDENKYRC